MNECAGVDLILNGDPELRFYRRDLIPFALLRQHGGVAVDMHNADATLTAQRNIGRSSLQCQSLAWCGAGAFRED
ncbi:hypothetical protein D3C80_935210 [compost metagenome]